MPSKPEAIYRVEERMRVAAAAAVYKCCSELISEPLNHEIRLEIGKVAQEVAEGIMLTERKSRALQSDQS